MLIIAGYVRVDPERRDAFVEGHADLVQRARAAAGCLDVAISADAVDSARVNTFELWEDEDTLNAWRDVAHGPDLGIEMVDANVTKYFIEGTAPPFDE